MNEKQQRDVIKEQDVGLQRLLLSPEGTVLRTEEMEGVDVEEKLAAARAARQEIPAGHEARLRLFERIAECELAAGITEVSHGDQATEER
jgi:hypothetical protein